MKVFRCFYEAHMRSEQVGPCRLFLEEKKPLLQSLADEGKLMTFCLYENGPHLYLYYESLGVLREPGELLTGCESFLLPYPGMDQLRLWAERTDVFHFNLPIDAYGWRRPKKPEKRRGSLAMLKPECISRYIFFHYGLQEERNFLGDKYEISSLRDNLLFGYFERPRLIEEPALPGRLHSGAMEAIWKEADMGDNFYRWPDTGEYWKDLPLLIEIYPNCFASGQQSES